MNCNKITVKKINEKRFENSHNLKPDTFHRKIKPSILKYAHKHKFLNNIIGNNPDIGLDADNIIYLISRTHQHKQISLETSINTFL